MPSPLLLALFFSTLPFQAVGQPPNGDAAPTVGAAVANAGAPARFDYADLPFVGSVPFVGRVLVSTVDGVHLEVGVEAQVVPLNLVLASTRDSLVSGGVSNACAGSSDASCAVDAQANAVQALTVIEGIPDDQWSDVLAAAANPAMLATTLRSAGVTKAADIRAVQQYVKTIPLADRAAVLGLARHLAEAPPSVRLEPYTSVAFGSWRVRFGVPISVGSASSIGNLNVDVATGWTFPFRFADLGVSVGLATYLPTASGAEPVALMADLFQAPKYLPGTLTATPYVVAGVDGRWASLLVHADVAFQAGVRGPAVGTNAEIFQYGTGLTLGPHFPVSLVAQLEGLEGLHDARAYRSLFAIGGLQANVGAVHLGVAAQVPVVDRSAEALGTYDGVDVGSLARYTVLARSSASF